ncbi:MAG: VTT domain-containing protein [Firmicutes bacterium]|nr:VTT domain-containing protein [Bacillota bacterium]
MKEQQQAQPDPLKEARRAKLKKLFTILKLAALILIIIAVPVYILVFHQDWIAVMRDMDQVRSLIANYKGIEAAFIYVGAQIIQIIISVIPVQALQIAAGFMFGFLIALGLSVIGAAVGTVITYYLGKVLGRDAMHLIFGEEQINQYVERMNSRNAAAIVFLIYLIPGIPKDVVSYAAGISSMRLRPFLLLSLVGRLPGMIASLLIGKQIFEGDYHIAIIIAVIASVAFILGIVFRKRLMAWFDKAYTKIYAYDEKATEKHQIKHEMHAEKRAEIHQKLAEKAKQHTKGGSHEV